MSNVTGAGSSLVISVLICTRDREESLVETLESIAAAAAATGAQGAELVVVDNGSTDNTPAILRAWQARSPLPTTIVHEPRPGLSIARNAALRAARGRLLVFTDDDCVMQPDYLARLLAHEAASPVPCILGGRVELGDPTDLPFTIKLDDDTQHYTELTHPGAFILGCNMVIPRAVQERVGFFDEWLGAGAPFKAAEEADYFYRAHLLGIPLRYEPDLVVTHFHGRKELGDIVRLNRGYHLGGGALYAKHAFRGPLLRHFYWDLRNTLREFRGGRPYNAQLGLSYRSMLAANVRGMLGYWTRGLTRRP